jgi:hypothetical protein
MHSNCPPITRSHLEITSILWNKPFIFFCVFSHEHKLHDWRRCSGGDYFFNKMEFSILWERDATWDRFIEFRRVRDTYTKSIFFFWRKKEENSIKISTIVQCVNDLWRGLQLHVKCVASQLVIYCHRSPRAVKWLKVIY